MRDRATIDYISERFPKPFFSVPIGASLWGSVLTRPQFVKPCPHDVTFGVELPQDYYSWYHSLQTKVERRFPSSFRFQLGWTWSKFFMGAAGLLKKGDPGPEEVLSSLDYPHRLGVSAIYELPFRSGRRMATAPAILEKIAGGWQVQGICTAHSGPMLGFGDIFYGDTKNVALPVKQPTVKRWFNTDTGFERPSARQPSFNYRVLRTRLASVRGDGLNQMNLSLLANTSLWERARLQFRLEAINALNNAIFRTPTASVTSTPFGRISVGKGRRRLTQLGFKLPFWFSPQPPGAAGPGAAYRRPALSLEGPPPAEEPRASVRRQIRRELETAGIQAAGGELADALLDRVSHGLDAAKRDGFGGVELQCDPPASQRRRLLGPQGIRRASDQLRGICG